MDRVSDVAVVGGWVAHLAGVDRDVPDAGRIELIRQLEVLKAAAAAAQARLSSDFDASQRDAQEAAGVPAARVGRGIAEQVALARRDSAHRGGQHLGTGKALTREMPHTLEALTWGRISEWRATLLVRESAYLCAEDRAVVDAELAGPDAIAALETMSDREVVAAAQRIAYRLDARAVADRARRAEAQRRVTLRPAPDTMSYLTGLVPVAQGVACVAVLTRAADTARTRGDERSRGQVMADTLVAALGAFGQTATGQTATGQTVTGDPARPLRWADADSSGSPAAGEPPAAAAAPDPVGPAASVSVQLVMTDRALLAGDDEPAHLTGYGTVPAAWARDLLRTTAAAVWVRRLYTHPETGELLAADATSRFFRGGLRQVLIARDQWCRTPYCDGPVRHADHVLVHVAGGADQPGQRPGHLRAVQPRQTGPRLDRPRGHPARGPAHGADHHPDRAPVPLPAPPRCPEHRTPHHPAAGSRSTSPTSPSPAEREAPRLRARRAPG